MEEVRGAPPAAPLSAATQAILDDLLAGNATEHSYEQLIAAQREAREKLNPFGAGAPAQKRFVNFAVMNLQRDYQQMLALTSVSAYLFCMAEEHFARDAAMYADAPAAKAAVLKFLNHFFEYNPNLHVAEMRKKHPTEEARKRFAAHCKRVREFGTVEKVGTLESAVAQFQSNEAAAKAKLAELHQAAGPEPTEEQMAQLEAALAAMDAAKEARERGEALLVKARRHVATRAAYDKPLPYDTFYWFSTYFRSNYEALREATEALYPVRSFLDEMLIIYDGQFETEDEAKVARRRLGGEHLPIHTTKVGHPTVYGPTKDNIDRTEFAGEGWEVFRSIIDFHQREAEMGQQMLQHISKVRKTREGVEVADPQKVQEFAQFCRSLRSAGGERELTEKEQALLAAADQADGEATEEVTQAALALRDEREAIEDEAVVAGIPDGCLATQLVSTNPDTGALEKQTVYFKSEEAQAADRQLAKQAAGERPPEFETGN